MSSVNDCLFSLDNTHYYRPKHTDLGNREGDRRLHSQKGVMSEIKTTKGCERVKNPWEMIWKWCARVSKRVLLPHYTKLYYILAMMMPCFVRYQKLDGWIEYKTNKAGRNSTSRNNKQVIFIEYLAANWGNMNYFLLFPRTSSLEWARSIQYLPHPWHSVP